MREGYRDNHETIGGSQDNTPVGVHFVAGATALLFCALMGAFGGAVVAATGLEIFDSVAFVVFLSMFVAWGVERAIMALFYN